MGGRRLLVTRSFDVISSDKAAEAYTRAIAILAHRPVMCGWPPVSKGFVARDGRRSVAVMCTAF